MSSKVLPLTKLLKKDKNFEWSEACELAFEEIKVGLLMTPTLLAPILDKPLILYISHTKAALAAILAQADDSGESNLFIT